MRAARAQSLDIATVVIGPGREYDDPYGDWARLSEVSDGARSSSAPTAMSLSATPTRPRTPNSCSRTRCDASSGTADMPHRGSSQRVGSRNDH